MTSLNRSKRSYLLAFTAIAVVALSPLAGAESTGPLMPTGVSTSVTQGTSAPWTSPSRTMGSDDLFATATSTFNNAVSAFVTDTLVFTFDLSGIPENATIDGMVLTLEGNSLLGTFVRCGISSSAFPVLDWAPNFSDQHLPSGPGDSVVTFGSPTDNWSGVTLSILTDPSNELGMLGFYFTSDDYEVDDVSLDVYFTPGASGVSLPASSSWRLVLTALLILLVGLASLREIRARLS